MRERERERGERKCLNLISYIESYVKNKYIILSLYWNVIFNTWLSSDIKLNITVIIENYWIFNLFVFSFL